MSAASGRQAQALARTIWLASYPKSGNTWTRALLTGLTPAAGAENNEPTELAIDLDTLGHGPIASARGLLESHLGFASSDLTSEEAATLRPLADSELNSTLDETRFRKIHDGLRTGPGAAPIISVSATRGAVYIVRDPREVAVSYAHHSGMDVEWGVRTLAKPGASEGSGKYLFSQFPQVMGTWSEHVTGWLDHDLFDVLLVRYEDLHQDTARELRRIAAFADLPADDRAIERAVEGARFEHLQAKEAESGFAERPRRDGAFFRRGKSGAWAEELPAELARQVAADHAPVMSRLGYL